MGQRGQAASIPVRLSTSYLTFRFLILNRYWDWADPKVDIEGLPALFYTDELTILATGRESVTVPNPLKSFTFPYLPRDFGDSTRVSTTSDWHPSVW